ncbi:MAG: LOG family protein [Planctomycetia bacterium]|nr:LOG family protein [Planctomycetia bacterium]
MTLKNSDRADLQRNEEILLNSPSYRLANEDHDFLNGYDGRETRILGEFMKPEKELQRANVVSTVIVFGSARILSPEVAQARVDAAQKELDKNPDDEQNIAALQRAKNALYWSDYYRIAREFGELVARKNDVFNETRGPNRQIKVSKQCEFVVCTGGGPGIMEAANRGAYDAGEHTIGLNIQLPFEQKPNPFVSPNLCFNFHYFSMRKMHFLLRAKALAAFPGGFGTFDELFEAITLRQTGRMQDLPIILFGEEFWKKVVNFQYLVDVGVISASDLNLFHYAHTAEEGWDIIERYYSAREKHD